MSCASRRDRGVAPLRYCGIQQLLVEAAADSGFAYGVGSVWDSVYLERHELITHSFLEHGREEGPTREEADCLPRLPLEWGATLAHLQKGTQGTESK